MLVSHKIKLNPLNPNPEYRFILSGGGTGGHIFPAIAIAQALGQQMPQSKVLFVGAQGKMEMERVPAQGFEIVGIPISGLQRKWTLKNLKLPFQIIYSLWSCRKILKTFKPHVVIGTGGYASGPLLFTASLMKIPVCIQEQNSYPGITNKILSKYAKRIYTGFPHMEPYFNASKIVYTGNPVRNTLEPLKITKSEAVHFFNLQTQQKTLLVLGGSLGARPLNQALYSIYETLLESDIQIIWQTGGAHFKEYKHKVKQHKGLYLIDFIANMEFAYAASDLIISRAGASSLSELMAVLKPAILVPSPYVAEDHQTKNAQALVRANAAVLLPEQHLNRDLKNRVLELLQSPEQLKSLTQQLLPLQKQQASMQIAKDVINLLKTELP